LPSARVIVLILLNELELPHRLKLVKVPVTTQPVGTGDDGQIFNDLLPSARVIVLTLLNELELPHRLKLVKVPVTTQPVGTGDDGQMLVVCEKAGFVLTVETVPKATKAKDSKAILFFIFKPQLN